MITLLSCLKKLKARDLTCELFKGVGNILKHQSFCEMVVELGNAFGWEQLEEALVALLESAVDINMKISCNFLSSLATGSLSSQRFNVWLFSCGFETWLCLIFLLGDMMSFCVNELLVV